MDEPLFLPGDQKTLVRHGAACPRLVAAAFFVVMLGVAFIGVACLYVGEWAAGAIMLASGLGVAGFMAQRYIAVRQMTRRMRKRGSANSNEPKST